MKRLTAMALMGIMGSEVALSKPACDELAGSVIFYDTLYGAGTGAVISGLVILASDDHEDSGRKMAGGTLLGATIGVAAGALELGMRDCDSGAKSGAKPGLSAGIAIVDRGPAASFTWTW